MSRVRPAKESDDLDSVKRSSNSMDDRRRAMDVLMEAQQCYMGWDDFRRQRERCKRYTYGDQWGDKVCVNGTVMTEEQYLRKQGKMPLKNNLIRRLVRSVIGVWLSQATEPTCVARDRDEQNMAETMSTALQCNAQINRSKEIDARSLEEFLISGLVVHRKSFGWRNDKMDCWTDYVQPNNFFCDNNMRDFRAWDCSLIGEVHDVGFEQLCSQFAHSPADFERLAEIYRLARDRRGFGQMWSRFGQPETPSVDFLFPSDQTRCRVIEVWRKESKPRFRCHDYNNGEIFKVDIEDFDAVVGTENRKRLRDAAEVGMSAEDVPLIRSEWFMDDYWYFYYLTPFGYILAEGETPYEHRSHPYVFKAYPFIDGETHSFVSDVIDQQRYTNRLIMMQDMIMQASAKGVLMVPEDCIPDWMTAADFAEEWVQYNGVIIYKPSTLHRNIPQQVSANSTNIGIDNLLSIQLKFFEDISGVHGALQGKQGTSGMSGALYNLQTQNAATSLLDLLQAFNNFKEDAAYKDIKNMQQFYDSKRTLNIVGRGSSLIVYDPQKIRDVEFDLSVVPSTATPVYRALANEFLMQMLQMNLVGIKEVLEVGDFPFADRLLQVIQSHEEAMAQQQQQASMMPPSESGFGNDAAAAPR